MFFFNEFFNFFFIIIPLWGTPLGTCYPDNNMLIIVLHIKSKIKEIVKIV